MPGLRSSADAFRVTDVDGDVVEGVGQFSLADSRPAAAIRSLCFVKDPSILTVIVPTTVGLLRRDSLFEDEITNAMEQMLETILC